MLFCILFIVWLFNFWKLFIILCGIEDGVWFFVVKFKLLWNLLVIYKSDLMIICIDVFIIWFIVIDI